MKKIFAWLIVIFWSALGVGIIITAFIQNPDLLILFGFGILVVIVILSLRWAVEQIDD